MIYDMKPVSLWFGQQESLTEHDELDFSVFWDKKTILITWVKMDTYRMYQTDTDIVVGP